MRDELTRRKAGTFRPRAVHVIWDDGAQEVDGVLRAATNDGILLNPLFDLTLLPGVVWVRRTSIDSIIEYPKSSLEHRASLQRDYLEEKLPAALTRLSILVDQMRAEHELVMVFREATGSGMGKVGWIEEVTPTSLRMTIVDRAARVRKKPVEVALSEVISLVWGDYYMAALSEILAAETKGLSG